MSLRQMALAAVLLALCLAGCSRSRQIVLDTSDPLALAPNTDWAVVSIPYATFYEDCTYDSPALGHARRGDVLMVTGKRLVHKEDGTGRRELATWYSFAGGWLEASAVALYDNKFKAESAARELMD